MSGHTRAARPSAPPLTRTRPSWAAAAAIVAARRRLHAAPAAGTTAPVASAIAAGRGQRWLRRPRGHPHRGRVDVRRAVLRRGLRPVPAAASRQ